MKASDPNKRADLTAGDYVAVSVSDTGCGMSEESLSKAFEPVFTTQEPRKRTGLGLSLVHRIISDHGGTIRVESRPGRTCFTFSLPATGPA